MSTDVSIKSQIVDLIKKQGAKPFGAYPVIRIFPNKTKKKRILIFADKFIQFAKKKSFSRNYSQRETYLWYDLVSIAKAEHRGVLFQFKYENVHIITKTRHDLLDSTYFLIQRILSPSELKKVTLPEQKVIQSKCNLFSAAFRFKNLCTQKTISKNPIYKEFIYALKLRQSSLDKIEFPNHENHVEYIFQCLPMTHYLTKLGFSANAGERLLSYLVKNKNCFEYINKIRLRQPLNQEFVKNFYGEDGAKACCLSLDFQEDYDHSQIELISELLETRSCITCLSFHKKLQFSDLLQLTSLNSFQKLRYLELNKLKNIDLSKIAQNLGSLYALSLTKCSLPVGHILSVLGNYNFQNLRKLNISGNVGSNITETIQLPPNLSEIYANNIQWNADSFHNFIHICSQERSNIYFSLSLAYTSFIETDWEHMENDVSNVTIHKLRKLTFDGNYIGEKFINRLCNCKNLEYFSANDCITPENMPFLITLINKCDKLKTLNMKRSKGDLQQFLSVVGNSSLTSLDISFNDTIDDELILLLPQTIIQNERLEFIAFDGAKITSTNTLTKFFDFLECRPNAIKISYPKFSMINLIDTLKGNDISKDQIKRNSLKYHDKTSAKSARSSWRFEKEKIENNIDSGKTSIKSSRSSHRIELNNHNNANLIKNNVEKYDEKIIHKIVNRFNRMEFPSCYRPPIPTKYLPFEIPFDVFNGNLDDTFPEYLNDADLYAITSRSRNGGSRRQINILNQEEEPNLYDEKVSEGYEYGSDENHESRCSPKYSENQLPKLPIDQIQPSFKAQLLSSSRPTQNKIVSLNKVFDFDDGNNESSVNESFNEIEFASTEYSDSAARFVSENSSSCSSARSPRKFRSNHAISEFQFVEEYSGSLRNSFNSNSSMSSISYPRSPRNLRSVASKKTLNSYRTSNNFTNNSKINWTPNAKKYVRWQFPLRFPPEIDNTVIINNMENDFSLEQLIDNVRKT
ncbi:hypothetical protein TRFO_00908 [Tritrichomonas foetus]|uniref:Leucine Rich Repeat family protein n=1 Tax=Tritrichomonas foetus TaxID=1144522 RepID=A0A1J4L6K5_9EUKA|nr:hypothetical protein TRFO_00908 [Tritrichomonas foetus]|eukprot:OHT17636.1 hypothetical protein TRFO_00908 [Tritrichomonas foetus]